MINFILPSALTLLEADTNFSCFCITPRSPTPAGGRGPSHRPFCLFFFFLFPPTRPFSLFFFPRTHTQATPSVLFVHCRLLHPGTPLRLLATKALLRPEAACAQPYLHAQVIPPGPRIALASCTYAGLSTPTRTSPMAARTSLVAILFRHTI